MLITDQPVYRRVYAATNAHNTLQAHACNNIDKNRYAMLRTITELAIAEARRVVRLPAWADSDQLPSCYTTRRELATLVGCGERTVYNCISVLERAGLVQKILHGRQNDFELVLHPWIIFGDNFQPPIARALEKPGKREKSTPEPDSPPHQRQNLPPISSYEAQERSIISSNSGVNFVEKWEKPTFAASLTQNSRVVDQGKGDIGKASGIEEQKSQIPAENGAFRSVGEIIRNLGGTSHHQTHEEKADGRAGNSQELRIPGPAQPRQVLPLDPVDPDQALQNLKKDLTTQFWQRAKDELWPNDYIGPDYENRLLKLVWREVFGSWMGQLTPNQVTTLYLTRTQQLDNALRYAQKHHWTGFLPPPLYFSRQQYLDEKRTNKRGSFWWTYEWIKQAKSKRKTKMLADQLARAVHSVVSGTAPRGLKGGRDYDRIQLYQYWHNRLGKYGDSTLLDEFDSKVSTLIIR